MDQELISIGTDDGGLMVVDRFDNGNVRLEIYNEDHVHLAEVTLPSEEIEALISALKGENK